MKVLFSHQLEYPASLRDVPDAPEKIYVRGELPSIKPCVALVGSRAASGHGQARAHELARELTTRGVLVISGGAVGIDAAAHAGALEAGGPTVAVLGTGLDHVYPTRHKPLFEAIVAARGGLVTSFDEGAAPLPWHFPRRNRIMAALSDAVVVVEASPGSGSLYTTQAASEYGRLIGACPGTAGTEALLAQGAFVAETVSDILEALSGRPRLLAPDAPLVGSDEALALLALHPAEARDATAVSELCGVSPARIARALTALELGGLALALPGGRYVRSASADRTTPSA